MVGLYLDGSPAWLQHVPLPPRRLVRGCPLFLRPSPRERYCCRRETKNEEDTRRRRSFPLVFSSIFHGVARPRDSYLSSLSLVLTLPPPPALCPSATSLPFSASPHCPLSLLLGRPQPLPFPLLLRPPVPPRSSRGSLLLITNYIYLLRPLPLSGVPARSSVPPFLSLCLSVSLPLPEFG